MSQGDVSSVLLIAGVLILVGLAAMVWDKVEKGNYLNSISHHADTREFLDGWPPRPQFGALKAGGWIAITIGVLLLLGGIAFRIWG